MNTLSQWTHCLYRHTSPVVTLSQSIYLLSAHTYSKSKHQHTYYTQTLSQRTLTIIPIHASFTLSHHQHTFRIYTISKWTHFPHQHITLNTTQQGTTTDFTVFNTKTPEPKSTNVNATRSTTREMVETKTAVDLAPENNTGGIRVNHVISKPLSGHLKK